MKRKENRGIGSSPKPKNRRPFFMNGGDCKSQGLKKKSPITVNFKNSSKN
jgi:hypothetical protein